MLLGIAALVQPVTRSALWLFTTQGRARELFQWGVISAIIAVASIVVGLPWGALGVAAAYAASDLLLTTPLLFWFVGRKGPVRAADFYYTIAPPFLAAAGSLAVVLVCRPYLGAFQHLVARLILAFLLTVAVSLLVLAALPAGRLAIRNFRDTLMLLLNRRREYPV
jgi:PST family polysaccharide transporter